MARKNKLDPKNLTIGFQQLMRQTIQDRINFFRSGGASYFESLTPTQLAQLFPKYYQQALPDIGKAVSGGTKTFGSGGGGGSATATPYYGGGGGGGSTGGGGGVYTGGTTGGAGGPNASVGAGKSAPTGTLPKPTPSTTQSNNSLLSFLEKMTGKNTYEDEKTVSTVDPGKQSLPGTWNIRKDIPPDGRPASVRYNNPGASWSRKRDELYGIEGYGIIGGGNRIGKFPTLTHGLASNMDLFSTSSNYMGQTLEKATFTWRGNRPGNVPKFQMSNGTVVDGRTVITPQLAKNEEFMYNVFKSYAQHEAGLKGTVSDTQIREAFKMYNAGGVEGYKKLSEQPSAGGQQNTEKIKKPDFYSTLDPKLREHIESLPNSDQQKVFQQLEHIKQQNGDINNAYQQFLEKSKGNPEEAAKSTVDAVKTTPATQLVKYGVGIVNGQKIDQTELINRERNAQGTVSFGIPGLENISFKAVSGGDKESVPQGTYTVTPQPIGPVISNYYQRFGQSTSGEFGTVFNVGSPGSPTTAGYDPKAGYTRTQIQFHAFPIKSQLDKMKSNGCIVMPPDQYKQFVGAMQQAANTVGPNNIALSVTKNKDGTFEYKIIPAQQTQNPITPEQAMQQPENISPPSPTQQTNGQGYFIGFRGLNDQIDEASFNQMAKRRGLIPKLFNHTQEKDALEFIKDNKITNYQTLGFSAGVHTQNTVLNDAKTERLPLPSKATSVGQYAPTARDAPGNAGVPTTNYVDDSGKAMASPNVTYIPGVTHMPTKNNPGILGYINNKEKEEEERKKQEAAQAQKSQQALPAGQGTLLPQTPPPAAAPAAAPAQTAPAAPAAQTEPVKQNAQGGEYPINDNSIVDLRTGKVTNIPKIYPNEMVSKIQSVEDQEYYEEDINIDQEYTPSQTSIYPELTSQNIFSGNLESPTNSANPSYERIMTQSTGFYENDNDNTMTIRPYNNTLYA